MSGLIASYQISDILLLLRRPLDLSHTKIHQLVINFNDLYVNSADIQGDIIFSCLGTTRGETPDPELYKKIDMEYPLCIARYGLENGVSQFHIISSIGADASSISSYLKLKGELENDLKKYKSIPAETVGRAMLNQSLKDLKGSFIYSSIQIEQLA